MENLKIQLGVVKEHVDLLVNRPLTAFTDTLDGSEAAKFNIAVAYTLASLCYILKRASGDTLLSMKDISEELSRIKEYVAKMNSNNNKRCRIDTDAVSRFIVHQLA